MKTLIICKSVHHKNTMKIAEVIAEVLEADIKSPTEISSEKLQEYDLIGFGSGIYDGKHHAAIYNFLENVKLESEKPAFVFTSSTVPTKYFQKEIIEKLTAKNFRVVDDFICKGLMTHSFTKYIFGGLNKKHPNAKDLQEARLFAEGLIDLA